MLSEGSRSPSDLRVSSADKPLGTGRFIAIWPFFVNTCRSWRLRAGCLFSGQITETWGWNHHGNFNQMARI
jgi:hypothetical protein